MRRALVVGNWKMNGSLAANEQLVQAFRQCWDGSLEADVALCPPFVYLAQVRELLGGSDVELGAQDVSRETSGAFTGEIAAGMLADLGCRYVIVGHSERREYHAEGDALVADKARVALEQGLTPIVCVGESRQQREADETLAVVEGQLDAVLQAVGEARWRDLVIAYEPVWAIGTGLTATPAQAQEVHAAIRARLGSAGDRVALLYGGSVKPDNAAELFAEADIDGALVGGASLKGDDFYQICKAAAQARA